MPWSQVFVTCLDGDGKPKLLLRFTTWPFYTPLLLVYAFMQSSGFTPVKHLALIGVLLYAVTSPLVLGCDGIPSCYFALEPSL